MISYSTGAYVSKERREGRDPIFDLNGMMLQPPNPGPYSGVMDEHACIREMKTAGTAHMLIRLHT